ncbi:MAG: ABC transporter permease [Verrucomicrobiales bacterium]|nr:ABC transporter permease [Verrucomicrobiales bacterium]|tara:strand:- start:552 stop:1505 length:954 start_codon:yes stop_codon:yes gene_type:complete
MSDVPTNLSPNQRALRRFLKNRLAVLGLLMTACVVGAVFLWPLVVPDAHSEMQGWVHHPDAHSDEQFAAPTGGNLMGTDIHGRDLLSRVLSGTRISLIVGAIGALVSLVIGVSWGAIAGFKGGRTDAVMMRTVDVLYTLPSIIFVIVFMTTLDGFLPRFVKSGTINAEWVPFLKFAALFVGLGGISWLTMARIVRGHVLSLRSRPFIEASRALGISNLRILKRHILPNSLGLIIVYLTLTIPAIILYESFLSYLGLGIQPPQASLGTLIADGAMQINSIRIYWWLLTFPAGMLVTTLLALNFVGDGLRDAFDPKAEG